ncbi:hypothetical protein LCGC14_1170970 [marine sediment metagenome]|uniref:ThuA-like domain-containing protein n=1 Tax=marine sediment metagenome TaxID=412755 RepID=A0A0F9P810_9ZZZZ
MRTRIMVSITAACLLGAPPAWGQPRVVIAAAANTNPANCRFTDIQAKLMATGRFSAVDIINTSSRGRTPSLAELQVYDAVLTWSNVVYGNPTAMGEVLADYVDAGGGVVLAVFANAPSGLRLGGRWISGGYEVIIGGSGQTQGTRQFLGTVVVPSHPIMNGVTTFDGGSSSFRPTATVLEPGSTEIAQWDDGRTLVAVGRNPKRADLGFYPPSSVCATGLWDSRTDGYKLLANALVFVAGCPGDLDGDGDTDLADLGILLADFGCTAPGPCPGDLDNDGDTDLADLGILLADFGCGAP